MKIFFKILLFTISIYPLTFAQIVFTDPTIPTQNDSIVVFFDATQPGANALLNYTGTVYAHTGVNTNLGTWQHVIGNWGQTNQPALTRLGANFYKLTIGYPRTFYSVTNPSEKILKLSMVFRSSDATKQTSPDIFIDLYLPGLTLVVQNPEVSVKFGNPQRSPAFVKEGETVPININAVELGTKVTSLTLTVDGNQVAQTNTKNLSYNFVYSNFPTGAHIVKVIGIDTTGTIDSTSFMIFSNPAFTNAPLPNGLKPGINYTGATTATLAIFAPYKDFIYLLGDFNDWKVEANYFMNRDSVNADSIIWWSDLTLSPGVEYAFQYLVDGKIRIGDPFSEKVLDQDNDKYISVATYPNLKPYPAGKTENIVSILQTAQSPYQWQTTNYQKPPKEKLVIYELLVRDFSSQHNYQFLIDTLSYLKSLGVNAIELMPINEFEGNINWGYSPSYHTAVDKYYGTANKLKQFIDVCHQNGIAVILDIVLNHAFEQNPLVSMYFDGYYTIGSNSGIKTTANNPYFNVTSPNTTLFWGADFNHAKAATQYYVDRVNRFWLEEYKCDGFRFDFTKGFTNTPGDGGGYDLSRINILKRMADKIWEYDSTSYIILEHFAANSEEIVLSNYGMMLWGNHNINYNQATMGYPTDAYNNTWNFSGISYKNRGWTNPYLVGYMESHDEERLMYKNLQYGNSSGSYNIKNLNEALNRMKLAAAFFFTIPGPKMIWQFGELGYDVSINFNGRTGEKPVKWDYLNDARRTNLYKVFKALINLKKNYDAFSTTNFTLDAANTIKKINLYYPTMDIFIIGNFGVTQLNPNQNFSKTGWWYDYFSGDSVNITNPTNPITLLPGEFKIYTSTKLPLPEQGILSDVELNEPTTVDNYCLEQNYPNPFNPSTSIRYAINSRQFVSLKVFDILGNEVAILVNEEKPAGSYEVSFSTSGRNAHSLSSGVYFYKLQAGSFVETKKMIVLK